MANRTSSQEVRKREGFFQPTVIGWHGIRFKLPPDWNLVSFSLERDSGYLRVDAPADGALTVQVRWLDAGRMQTPNTIYGYLVRMWGRSKQPIKSSASQPDLRASLERLLREIEKQAKKNQARFECHLKPEHWEGERRAIHFSWTGGGRGQGKIWHCTLCNRVVMAQVAGLTKDHAAIAAVAAQLFGTLQDHSLEGRNLWALYDLQVEIPDTFFLQEQRLYSGHLRLAFSRYGERLVVERWGLASTTLRRFTLQEWFQNQSLVNLKGEQPVLYALPKGHEAILYKQPLPLGKRLVALKNAGGRVARAATHYAGGGWVCEESNKIYIIQLFYNENERADLWEEIATRCLCHDSQLTLDGEKGA